MLKCLTATTLATAMTLSAAAQQANLSGTWKLNMAASFLAGDHPSPDYEFTKVLVQGDRTIHQTDIATHVAMMNIPLPDTKVETELTPDGQEHDAETPPPFPGMPPAHLKVSAEWQGNNLLVTERSAGAGRLSFTQRRYFLSNDGSHLIELVEAHNAFGDTEQRLVFDKQSRFERD
jgi:hypothetical protein